MKKGVGDGLLLLLTGSVILAVMFCAQDSMQAGSGDEFESLIESCGETVEGLTDDLRAHYRANEFPDDPVTHCFVRCLGLTLGLYEDGQGPDLHANWIHLGGGAEGDDEDAFVAEHRACLEELKLGEVEDRCERAYGAFQCFKDEYFGDTKKGSSETRGSR